MNNVLFIAWHDMRWQLRQAWTLMWLFVMPPLFFFFIGSVTAGFHDSMPGSSATPLAVEADAPGFLARQIDMRLRENGFAPEWLEAKPGPEAAQPARVLSFASHLSDRIEAGERVTAKYETHASELSRDYEAIRIRRSLYTVLADVAVAGARAGGTLSEAALDDVNAMPRVWRLDVTPAGKRKEIPGGFEQAVPGILVMFTLLVMLTSSSAMLVAERSQGLLRRLASAPMSRGEVVGGKWVARLALAMLQIGSAVAVGSFVFHMRWGPDFGMILLVLAAWAGFCASAGLALGNLARTDRQAAGFGVLATNALAALGGCWWPIEITPPWMQTLQKMLPTGWAMDALHKLISFQAGALSALPHVAALLLAALVVAGLAARRFRFQ
jgi:ABC-type Na+ efflux pump permease subunit